MKVHEAILNFTIIENASVKSLSRFFGNQKGIWENKIF